jgi:lipopolysaccharide export system protein LptA
VAKGLGFHSRLVTVLKVGLPLLALCLLSALFFFTLREDLESELVFSASDLEAFGDGLQVTRPTLTGRTRDDEVFRFVAESAVPDGAPPTKVAIRGLEGDFDFKGGQRVQVSAGSADLDLESDSMELRQQVTVASSDGYRISARHHRCRRYCARRRSHGRDLVGYTRDRAIGVRSEPSLDFLRKWRPTVVPSGTRGRPMSPTRNRWILPFLALAVGAFAVSVQAQTTQFPFGGGSHDASLPVEITSNALSLDQATGTATFTGDVLVGQGELRLGAERIDVFYTETEGTSTISRMVATGSVTLTNGLESAEADEAIYSVADGLVEMRGSVVLLQGSNVLSSDSLRLDLAAGTGLLEGRVQTIFVPGPTQ